MSLIDDLLAQLTHHHIARPDALVPERTGVSYIWAGNGIFKYGRNEHTEAVMCYDYAVTPGLPKLHSAMAWQGWDGKLPAALLDQVLAEARAAFSEPPEGEIAVPIEAQWFVVLRDGVPTLIQPAQRGTPGSVVYEMPAEPVLVDIHSHARARPFFSATDDRDDTWLSASVVIGSIFAEQPGIIARLNVYGDSEPLDAGVLFDGLGPFRDAYTNMTEADLVADEQTAPPPPPADQQALDDLTVDVAAALEAGGLNVAERERLLGAMFDSGFFGPLSDLGGSDDAAPTD